MIARGLMLALLLGLGCATSRGSSGDGARAPEAAAVAADAGTESFADRARKRLQRDQEERDRETRRDEFMQRN